MSKEIKEVAKKTIWEKPTFEESEKLLLKNLEGFCVKGAREIHTGWYPTGHFNLDFAVSHGTIPVNCDLSTIKDFDPASPGGIPRGRLVEVFGEPGGGKSSLCLRSVGRAQKQKKTCIWIDKEKSFVESLAEINGVDLDRLYKMDNPEVSAEEEFDHIYSALNDGADFIVVDSVVGLIPKSILDGEDSTKDTVALLARVMSKCVPKLANLCAKTGGTVVFINQVREKPMTNSYGGDPTTTPGGYALKFFSSSRFQITKRYGEKSEVWREDDNGVDQLIAQESFAYIRKNRMARPMREGIPIPIYFESYSPSPEEVAFDLGRQTQIIKVRNSMFSWNHESGDKVSGETVGRKSFIEAIRSTKKLDSLILAVKAAAADQGIILPPELMFAKMDSKKVIKKSAEQSAKSKEINEYLEEDAKLPQELDELSNETNILLSEKPKKKK